jgi:glutamate-1-semialdehyde aminotransferase
MEACERDLGGRGRVMFEGGTFSSHSEYMRAGLIILGHLAARAATVYPKLARSGEKIRRGIERAFADQGIRAKCTGDGNGVLPGSSLFMVHFPRGDEQGFDRPEVLQDARRMDIGLREDLLKLALLVAGVNVVHGGGAISTAHGTKELASTLEAYGEAARLFKKYLF